MSPRVIGVRVGSSARVPAGASVRGCGLRVVVVGGGIVGLACADELVQAGHDVTVFDPAPGRGATWAAAGMLAPGGEAWFGQEALLALGVDSLARWPSFAASLERRTGRHVGFRRGGSLLVGADRDDLAEVMRSCVLLDACGVQVEELDAGALRGLAPLVSTRVAGAVLLPHDCWVHPRLVTQALLRVLGERVVRARASVTGEGVLVDGRAVPADVVVVATGARGVPGVRPVRGEVVRVRVGQVPQQMLRAQVHGSHVYVVPRAAGGQWGELVIGATEEEHRFGEGRPMPTVGGVHQLLDTARELMPGLDSAQVLEVVARDRPGSPDNGPLLGFLPDAGPARVVVAGGHYRGGVLLAPVSAVSVRSYIDGGEVPAAARPFTPDRFAASRRDDSHLPAQHSSQEGQSCV